MGSPWINGQFTYDLSDNRIFEKDEQNYIDALGIQQLNTIGELYFLDIFLSKDNYVDLHYHSNASELTYCISGAVEISFINPTPNEWQNFVLYPGDAVSIPQGFWHCARALEDDTHLLAAHSTNNLQTIFGSDILRITPDEVMANIYCLDEMELAHVLAPIDETIVIGPPTSCEREVGGAGVNPEAEEHMPMFPNGGVGNVRGESKSSLGMEKGEEKTRNQVVDIPQTKTENIRNMGLQWEEMNESKKYGAELNRANHDEDSTAFGTTEQSVRNELGAFSLGVVNNNRNKAKRNFATVEGYKEEEEQPRQDEKRNAQVPPHYNEVVFTCPICHQKQYRS